MSNRGGTPIYAGIICSDEKRDVYEVAGYPKDLKFENFYSQFRRNPFAKAAVMRPVQRCWSTLPKIYDHKGEGDPKGIDSKFEQDVQYLIENKDLFKWLMSLDYRQRVGRYGGIIVVADEKEGATSRDELKVIGGVKSILSFRPVYEGQILVNDTEKNFKSDNFGNPINYTLSLNEASTSTKTTNDSAIIDSSRVFVCAEGADDGSVYGTSCLEPGFNAMLDLVKVSAAGAEGSFKNAKQRLHANINDEEIANAMFAGTSEEDLEDKKTFDENLKGISAGFDRELLTAGVDVKVLQATLSDPTLPFNISLQSFCAATEIPKTVLIGFETGERSSSENKSAWNDTMNSRRRNFLSEMITDFLNYLVGIGAIRAPENGICIVWDDLNTATEMEKIDIVDKMSSINEKSVRSGLGEIFTPDEMRMVTGRRSIDGE